MASCVGKYLNFPLALISVLPLGLREGFSIRPSIQNLDSLNLCLDWILSKCVYTLNILKFGNCYCKSLFKSLLLAVKIKFRTAFEKFIESSFIIQIAQPSRLIASHIRGVKWHLGSYCLTIKLCVTYFGLKHESERTMGALN